MAYGLLVVTAATIAGCGISGPDGLIGVADDPDCPTYAGQNPSPAELQYARRESSTELITMLTELDVPIGGDEARRSFIETNTTLYKDEIAVALSNAPAGSVAAYTEYLCDPPLDENSPEAAMLSNSINQTLEHAKTMPGMEHVDWDAASERMLAINANYAEIQAVMPLYLCGSAMQSGTPIDPAAQMPELSAEMQNWVADGWRLLCPEHVGPPIEAPSAAAANGAHSAQCGTVQLPDSDVQHDLVVVAGDIGCDEAGSVINRYLMDPGLQKSGNTQAAEFLGWLCAMPTAAAAEQSGYALRCDRDGDSLRILG